MDLNSPESMMPWLRSVSAAGQTPESTPSPAAQGLTVGEVAELVGISVRTLHHWDAVGLVRTEGRTSSGYRVYTVADVERIHRVLVYRELGFGLTQIAALLDDPAVDELAQLRQQQDLLEQRIGRLRQMADAVGQVLAARAAGRSLTAQQQAEIYGQGWREEWAEEARERWGNSDEWEQFERNAAALSGPERRQLHDHGEGVYTALAEAKRAGVGPGEEAANLLAERHREMVGKLFACTHSMQVCLGRLYVEDERFAAYFHEREPGLAAWLSAVIDANARRHGVDPEHAGWA